jgi:phage terminase large subunit
MVAVLDVPATTSHTFTFYGGARDFVKYHGHEAIIHGPAETGKTISALWKLHLCALKYPGASIVVCRKTLSSTYSTVLRTFTGKVLGNRDGWPCAAYGGEKPEWFDYPNGARVWMAGMDKSSKILSAEHDLIYVNQAEELTLDDWEVLTTRTTGRAGNMPYSQTIGDCNPASPSHWLYHRASLRLFYSRHEDNPSLYDPATGAITEQGQRTMAVLQALTGTRRQRLLEGKPAQAEGIVYDEWDESRHLVYDAPACVRHVAGVDWGYRNPGCIVVLSIDNDGVMYLVAQIYRAGETDDWWHDRARELQKEFRIEAFVCDPSQPAYIDKWGSMATKADNTVLPGINAVKQRLASGRLVVVRDSLRHADQNLVADRRPHKVEDEFAGYVWSDKTTKEQPVKEDDHGLDALRYAVMHVDGRGRGVLLG